jgi:hypothetical protein
MWQFIFIEVFWPKTFHINFHFFKRIETKQIFALLLVRFMPIFIKYSHAAPNPIASAIAGVPASNLEGGCAYVDENRSTLSIISPPHGARSANCHTSVDAPPLTWRTVNSLSR